MKATYRFFGKKIALDTKQTGRSECETKEKWSGEERPGGWVLLKSTQGVRRRVMLHESRLRLGFSFEGKLWAGDILRERASSLDSGPGADSELTAQFPGKVRKLLASDGDAVKEGDAIVLVEAMKMEFAVKAPSDGKIVRFLVKEGQQISPGDLFLDFEAAGE